MSTSNNTTNVNPITKKKKEKCLLFVESPGKCATIRKYLNDIKDDFEYDVIATIGHIKQLPSKNGSILVNSDKVDFLWEDKADSVKKLKENIKKSTYARYYIATDQDREGEGIAYHVYEVLQELNTKVPIYRITFNEITKKALEESIKNPRDINLDLVYAFLSRIAIDYLIGYTLSPLTWKLGKYSVGRVQSPSIRLVVEQEKVIFDFVQVTYYMIEGIFKEFDLRPKLFEFNSNGYKYISDEKLVDLLKNENNDVKRIPDEKLADDIISALLLEEYKTYVIDEINEKDVYRSPLAPFTTVTMQQEANTKLGQTISNTMRNAQKLYEEGLITYMRTDSTTINDANITVIRNYIQEQFGQEYLSEEVIQYKNKIKNAQEAHEAIRPTDIKNTGVNIEDPYVKALYELIWKRTVACQMSKALFKQKNIVLKNSICSMSLNGSQLVFLGYLKVYGKEEDEDSLLPPLKLKEKVTAQDMHKSTHHTKHPPRYTEGALIKQLEKRGIGRPSTYAGNMEILKRRNYVRTDSKALVGVMNGKILVAFLEAYFAKYIDYEFTNQVEESLDKIANGEENWQKFIYQFYTDLKTEYNKVANISLFEILDNMNKFLQQWLRNKICEKCGQGFNLYIKTNLFFCCSNKSCNHTIPLKDEYIFHNTNDDNSEDIKNKFKGKKFFKKTIKK